MRLLTSGVLGLLVFSNHHGVGDDQLPVEHEAEVVSTQVLRAQLKQRREDRKIEAALLETTKIEFIETPLQDVIEYLEDRHGIQIELDTRALDVVGIGSDTPITRDLAGITLQSALRIILRDLELTYIIQDEVLMITTPEVADKIPVTRVFSIGQIADDDESKQQLVAAIQVAIEIDEKRLATFKDRLIVRGTFDELARVEELLRLLSDAPVVEKHAARHPLEQSLGSKLDLSGLVSDVDLMHLVKQKQIELLDISANSVTDQGLGPISQLPKLRILNLSRTYITDAGVAHLLKLDQLNSLDLSETRITDAGMLQLEKLVSLTNLTVGSSQRHRAVITKKAVDALQKSLPNCKIAAMYYQPEPMKDGPARRKPTGDPFGGGGGANPFGAPAGADPFK